MITFEVYERLDGLLKLPELIGVNVIDPLTVGVIANVCAVEVALNVRTTGDNPTLPAPVGVIVIVPVYALFGVTVKAPDGEFILPDDGPVNVYVVACSAAVLNVRSDDVAILLDTSAEPTWK